MSMQLDFNDSDYELSSFNGAWIREMNRNIISLEAGKYVKNQLREHHQTVQIRLL